MSLKTLHAYLGQLLEAGVNPNLPVVGLTDGAPCEICDVVGVAGRYKGDPSPTMVAYVPRNGEMLVLVQIHGDDASELVNEQGYKMVSLPVDPPSPL